MSGRPLNADDLVRLSLQMEQDRELGWQQLQRRDIQVGAACDCDTGRQQLLCWLDRLREGEVATEPSLGESGIAMLVGLAMFLLGFFSMTGFLFAHPQGMVNVLWFFAVFVLLQWMLCLFSLLTLGAVVVGRQPAAINLNPARWLLSSRLPGRRQLAEFQDIVQLVFLRFGQGMGLAFIVGCMTAFLLVLALNDFTFVWSSTFELSNEALLQWVNVVSSPWSGGLPSAVISEQVIAGSRYYPTAGLFSPQQLDAMHSWWPFLFLSMAVYTLLPRLLLRWLSRFLYVRRMEAAFIGYPGVDLVLRRMRQPQVRTQGQAHETGQGSGESLPAPVDGTLVINWGDAIGSAELELFNELRGLGDSSLVHAGLSFSQDREALRKAGEQSVELAIVVVKSWEPPMSDLSDFVAELAAKRSCLVFLRPLNGQDIPRQRLEDWKRFSHGLSDSVQVKALNRAAPDQRGESP